MVDSAWLALMIGNSRLHWAYFVGDRLQSTWDSEHLTGPPNLEKILDTASPSIKPCQASQKGGREGALASVLDHFGPPSPPNLGGNSETASPSIGGREGALEYQDLPVVLASVVPEQTSFWQTYPNVQILSLDQIPLQQSYPTLGIDRALALWGAGETLGWPALVIDTGTALTFTGGDRGGKLIGGAILPGLGLQLRSLAQKTAALPAIALPQSLPNRWANDTPEAIQSGIIYTVMAGVVDFIQSWWQDFPGSAVVITGGDRDLLHYYLQAQYLAIAEQVQVDPNLIFWGIRACRETLQID